MTYLFITKYLSGEFDELQREIYILAVPYVIVFIAMALDLIAGIMKARRLGELTSSEGLKRSVSKFRDYYGMLLIATLMDILLSVVEVYDYPYVTFTCGLYLTFIEGLSIREKGEDKTRRQGNKDLKALITLLENRGDLITSFTEIVKQELNSNETKTEENETNIKTNS